MTQASHARTHMTNQGITRNPLPALLPTILAGLFILAGCGGSALPIDVAIAPTSANVANKLDTNVPVAGFLSVNEQPPVEKQEAEQEPKPAPVFEVAPPQERSFSQAEPEPQTSTETVKRSDATGESHASDNVITFADWTDSFSPALTDTATFTDNGFLAGAAIELEHRDADSIFMNADKIINAGRLNLSTTTFDGNAIGGDADDGVVFFRAEKDSQTYNYAGVLTGTNLGAPLVVEAAKTATWNGNFYALVGDVAIDTDFTLDVDFSAARTLKAKTYGKLDNYFTLENAIYNADGVISGGITIRSGANTATGVLTGLIGSDGAVAAFYSNDRGANSYAGGFVASPTLISTNTDVTNSDWVRSFSDGLPIKATFPATQNEFLVGSLLGGRLDATGAGRVVDSSHLSLATSTYNGVKLGGDFADGVSFFRTSDGIKNYNYAGLYSGTDLGAPLGTTFRGETTANWEGRIRTAGWFRFDTDFILKVNFGTRKLNVDRLENPADTDQWLKITDASYTATGVISGAILIDEDNDHLGIYEQYGFLTGLIGEQGAVAAFLSSGNNIDGATTTTGTKEDIRGTSIFDYAGGFVARPPVVVVENPNITIDDWTGTFDNLQRNVKRFSPPTKATKTKNSEVVIPNNAFLRREDVRTANPWKKPEVGLVPLNIRSLTLNATGGVDFFPADITIINPRRTGYRREIQRHYYGGIHSNTDLGAALPHRQLFNNDPMAEWDGKYSLVQGTKLRVDWNLDFKLTVNFMDASISADILEGTEANNTGKHFYLSGNYDANGVITGNVIYGVRTITNPDTPQEVITRESPNGILTGLIGQEGAVGVFVSGSLHETHGKNAIVGGAGDGGYAGGFVASP